MIDDSDDAGVIEPSEEPHLLREGGERLGVDVAQPLDGDGAAGGGVSREVHDTHAARGEGAEQAVGGRLFAEVSGHVPHFGGLSGSVRRGEGDGGAFSGQRAAMLRSRVPYRSGAMVCAVSRAPRVRSRTIAAG